MGVKAVEAGIWNALYVERGYFIKYPDEDLIRFMARHYYSARDRAAVHCLDFGCGVGRNSVYLAREGFRVTGVDATEEGVELARKRAEAEKLQIPFQRVADPLKLPFRDGSFDAVVDIQALECNGEEAVRGILGEIFRCLKRGGRLFSKFASTEDSAFAGKKGRLLEPFTLTDISEGAFAGLGMVHFLDPRRAKDYFKAWTGLRVEKTLTTSDGMSEQSVYLLIEATKP